LTLALDDEETLKLELCFDLDAVWFVVVVLCAGLEPPLAEEEGTLESSCL